MRDIDQLHGSLRKHLGITLETNYSKIVSKDQSIYKCTTDVFREELR